MIKDKWQNKIIDHLSFKYGIDKRVVENVVHYPLRVLRDTMNSPTDDTPVRVRHLGVFAYRGSRNKQKAEKPKYDTIMQAAEQLYELHYHEEFESLDHFVEYIIDRFKEADYSAIRKIHETFVRKVRYINKSETNIV